MSANTALMSPVRLAGVIIARNAEEHIVPCIESLHWTDAVVLYTSGSDDRTEELARAAGAVVMHNQFENFAQFRNAALADVPAEWIFFLDADERCTPALAREILAELENPAAVGYWIPRFNYIFGRITYSAGWYPDRQMRLLKRGRVRYERLVHEVAALDGPEGALEEHFIHYNYESVRQFLDKQNRYTDFEVESWYQEGRRVKLRHFILQPLRHFYWRYITLKGYTEGWHGLRLCALMAWFELQKFVRLARLLRARAER